MSTVWITSLVGIGLMALVAIAYGAHRMEMAKIERIRLAGLHRDRFRNLQYVLDVTPARAFKGELAKLVTKSMVLHMEQVIHLQGHSADVAHQLEHAKRLEEKASKGELIQPKPPKGNLDQRLKEVRRATKLLKDFILQQHRAGMLSKPAASAYIKSLQEINIIATVDGLLGQASHSLGNGNKATALRYYQLCLSEIRKCRNHELLAEQKKLVTQAIVRLKEDQKLEAESTQEQNQKLAKSITAEPDTQDFEMKQIN